MYKLKSSLKGICQHSGAQKVGIQNFIHIKRNKRETSD